MPYFLITATLLCYNSKPLCCNSHDFKSFSPAESPTSSPANKGQMQCAVLQWGLRFNIILGVAQGLLYLHRDSKLKIIHRNLKTGNILLDEEMNPKISDFGLAMVFGPKRNEIETKRIAGTPGYMPPEYLIKGHVSVKTDVFSFGVVILEIISGLRNAREDKELQFEESWCLVDYARRLWNEDKALDLMDQTLCQTCNNNEVLKCINVGLLCVEEDPNDRPTMSDVVFMLGSETETLPTPKRPLPTEQGGSSGTLSTISDDHRVY